MSETTQQFTIILERTSEGYIWYPEDNREEAEAFGASDNQTGAIENAIEMCSLFAETTNISMTFIENDVVVYTVNPLQSLKRDIESSKRRITYLEKVSMVEETGKFGVSSKYRRQLREERRNLKALQAQLLLNQS